MSFLTKIFGSQNDRFLKKVYPVIDQINSFEPAIKKLTDNELKAKTTEFKNRYKDGESLDSLLPEAFAVVREIAWRKMGQRHYDVQMVGAYALHKGMISEMKTGEGKTLAATPAVYLNAITGLGVHVITVNDYLAKRDAAWMAPVYESLGLTVGVVVPQMPNDEKRQNYNCDITYGTNNEFGFDYLRDNMVYDKSLKVQRGFNYCIVDEIDSILIDEARTPLIISGAAENDIKHIINARKLVTFFKECEKNPDGRYPDEADPLNPQKPVGDYKVDEKSKNITFTDDGMNKANDLLLQRNIIRGSLFDSENFEYIHYIVQALKAEHMFKVDVDYLVKDNQIMIIDEHTGRVLEGRRYSDGLHQAIEAKEGITVQRRSKTYASITFQNFFRMYAKLSGMTGTADTEAAEFKSIYNLDVVVIPTNLPLSRTDAPDRVYITYKDKAKAVVEDIKEIHKKGQPVLIGTISVESSEYFSSLLKKANIRHNVLNAKNHAREAEIVAGAGRVGAVTIATNMAGRGTDIKLGGAREYDDIFEELLQEEGVVESDKLHLLELKEHVDKLRLEEAEKILSNLSPHAAKRAKEIIQSAYDWIDENKQVKDIGGLFILGTERHESRRIDNQLRGRSGRQGDPGYSRFYISLEDDLMRLFGGERIRKLFTGGFMKMEEGENIESPMLSRAIEKAQKKVESRNYDIRKHLLEYDDVLNKQRSYIYTRRDDILNDKDIILRVKSTVDEIIEDLIDDYNEGIKKSPEESRVELIRAVKDSFFTDISGVIKSVGTDPLEISKNLNELLNKDIDYKNSIIGHERLNMLLRHLYLEQIDRNWQAHLENMEQLREAVYLRSYSQKNPLVEYKIEGSNMFEELIERIRSRVVNQVFRVRIESVPMEERKENQLNFEHSKLDSFDRRGGMSQASGGGSKAPAQQGAVITVVRNTEKVGRNDPCPCGSGKKYKHCCG